MTLDAEAPGTPVNRLLLGSNVQWVDRGDDLLDDGGRLRPACSRRARHASGILRYPGGSQADTYHWERGLGVPGARGENEHFHSKRLQSTSWARRSSWNCASRRRGGADHRELSPRAAPRRPAGWVADQSVKDSFAAHGPAYCRR